MATRLEISLLKRLSELEQEFLGKFEKQIHALMVMPSLYTEQQIAQWHLPHAGELARLLTNWMRDVYAVGQAHGDLLVGDLERRFGKHKLVDWQPSCYRLASVGYSPEEFWLLPEEAIKEFSKRELLLAGDVEGDISKDIKGITMDHLHGIPRAQTEEAIANLLEKNKNRARLITTTETTYAYNRGRLTSYHGNDVDYVRFSAVMDMRTSPQCRSRHGLVMRLDSPELSGNIPPLHGRCRSVLSPLFSKYQPELITSETTDWSHVTPLPKGWRTGGIIKKEDSSSTGQSGIIKEKETTPKKKTPSIEADLPKVPRMRQEQLQGDYKAAPEGMRKILRKYARETEYDEIPVGMTSHYSCINRINMSISRTGEGYGRTFWHEMGHAVDNQIAKQSGLVRRMFSGSESRYALTDFQQAIKADVADFRTPAATQRMLRTTKGAAKQRLRNKIMDAVATPGSTFNNHPGVSDIFSCATKNDIHGTWQHSTAYLKKGLERPSAEIFANLWQLYFQHDAEAIAFLKETLPRTLAEFEKIISQYGG